METYSSHKMTGTEITHCIEYQVEDRVIANISNDPNKIAVFTEGLDGHSLAACYYFKEEIIELIGPYNDYKEASRKLKALVDEGNSTAKSIRQRSKPISLTYKRLHAVMHVEKLI